MAKDKPDGYLQSTMPACFNIYWFLTVLPALSCFY